MAFNTSNLIPAFTSTNWSVSGGSAVISSNEINLTPGSSVSLIINDDTSLSAGTRFKLQNTFSDNSGLYNEYKLDTLINVFILYTDNTSDCYTLSFNEKYKILDSNVDETTINTHEVPISSIQLEFINKSTDIDVHITQLVLYKDMSVSKSEIKSVVNNEVSSSLSDLASYTFPVYWSDNAHSSFSIGAILEKDKSEIIFKPVYEDGIVTKIITNAGITFTIPNYIGDPFE